MYNIIELALLPSNAEWVVRKRLAERLKLDIFWAPVENSGRRAQHCAAQMASVRNKCKIGGNIHHNCKWEVLVIAPRVRTRLNITLDIRLTAFKCRYLSESR